MASRPWWQPQDVGWRGSKVPFMSVLRDRKDVALDAGSVSIRQQLQRVDGKFTLRELKTKSSRRTLPLTADAKAALQAQKANQLLWSSIEDPFNPLGLVFTTAKGKPLYPKTVDENLKAFAKAAGIEKPISFHKLRHTAGTHLVANGVPLNVVKEILGHSQIAVTANLYAHAVPAAHKTAFDVLERAYQGNIELVRSMRRSSRAKARDGRTLILQGLGSRRMAEALTVYSPLPLG